nr:hypothetical protein HmN_000267200 [Hymenolepis microstoma]
MEVEKRFIYDKVGEENKGRPSPMSSLDLPFRSFFHEFGGISAFHKPFNIQTKVEDSPLFAKFKRLGGDITPNFEFEDL